MKSAGKARSNGLYRHIRTSKEIIRNLLNDYYKKCTLTEPQDKMKGWKCYEAFDDVPIDLGYGMYDGRDFFCRRKYRSA